jgi:D-alanyl-D-alanine carboxypeptidase
VLIANKTYGLPKDYDPYEGDISPEAQLAFKRMQGEASKSGLNLYISSGYRSYSYQVGLYDRYVKSDGKEAADLYSARPGYSEHQTGLCFDLNTIDDSFAYTDEGIWVAENCYKYGFIVRYPKGKESSTGYQYEPWHLRYLGVDLATKVYNSGLSLEEYLGITSKYSD